MNKIDVKNRQAFKRSMIRTEDGLSYNVFNRLSYLSPDLFGRILSSAFDLGDLDFTTLNEINFWPKWNVRYLDDVTNKNFIEPDIFLRFDQTDILIEAKRYDFNQQSEHQWMSQINTYYKIYEGLNKNLIYIALGGISYSKWTDSRAKIIQTFWFKISQACKERLSKNNLTNQEYRIIQDVLKILIFYNHKPLSFLNTLKSRNITSQKFNF